MSTIRQISNRDIEKINQKVFQGLRMRQFPAISFLELFVAFNCNLRCRYCFVGKKKKQTMTKNIAKKSVDFLIRESRKSGKLSIIYFGGEPLLEYNLIKEITVYAEDKAKEYGKELSFSMTTNGTLLNEDIMAFSQKHRLNLLLSIDGDRETHDEYRRTVNNKGSFDIIESKISLMKKYQPWLGARMTVRASTAAKVFTNVQYLINRGINQFIIEPDHSDSWNKKALTAYKEEWRKLLSLYLKKRGKTPPLRLTYFEKDIEELAREQKNAWGCSAARGALTISPSGGIYPCSKFLCLDDDTAKKRWILGNVKKGLTNFRLRAKLNNQSESFRAECGECAYKDFCSGGCLAENYEKNKSIFKPYALSCFFKKMFVDLIRENSKFFNK